MKWHIYPAADIDRLAVGWDNLNERGADSPLLTSHFVRTALQAFGSGKEKIACLGSIAEPDCIAVMVERRRGVWETFQPAQAPIGFWLIRSDLELEATTRSLLQALPGFPLVLGITQQDPELMPHPATSVRIQTLDYIDTAHITVEGNFEAYWEKRGKNLRQNLRKARNKLEKAGLAARLVCLTEPAMVADAIAHYGQLESAGWKAKDGTAVHPENDQGRFYRDLLEAYCRNGVGRIYQLMFNDSIAAMDLCVERGDVIVILKTTYDEAMADFSPAMLMHQELFQAVFDASEFRRIEFYGKVMEWHLRWTESKRTMYHINYFRWGWLKRLLTAKPTTTAKIENHVE